MEHTNVYLRRTCLPNGCGIARATTCLLPCWLSLRNPDGHCRIASHSAPTDTKPETAYILCSKSPSSFRGAPIAAFHPSVLPSLQPPCNSDVSPTAADRCNGSGTCTPARRPLATAPAHCGSFDPGCR